jgi:hypothetical protein
MKLGFWLLVALIAANSNYWANANKFIMNSISTGLHHHHKKVSETTGLPLSEAPALFEEPAIDSEHEDAEALLLVPDARGGAAAPVPESAMASVLENLKIGFYFALWYALNIVYNSK